MVASTMSSRAMSREQRGEAWSASSCNSSDTSSTSPSLSPSSSSSCEEEEDSVSALRSLSTASTSSKKKMAAKIPMRAKLSSKAFKQRGLELLKFEKALKKGINNSNSNISASLGSSERLWQWLLGLFVDDVLHVCSSEQQAESLFVVTRDGASTKKPTEEKEIESVVDDLIDDGSDSADPDEYDFDESGLDDEEVSKRREIIREIRRLKRLKAERRKRKQKSKPSKNKTTPIVEEDVGVSLVAIFEEEEGEGEGEEGSNMAPFFSQNNEEEESSGVSPMLPKDNKGDKELCSLVQDGDEESSHSDSLSSEDDKEEDLPRPRIYSQDNKQEPSPNVVRVFSQDDKDRVVLMDFAKWPDSKEKIQPSQGRSVTSSDYGATADCVVVLEDVEVPDEHKGIPASEDTVNTSDDFSEEAESFLEKCNQAPEPAAPVDSFRDDVAQTDSDVIVAASCTEDDDLEFSPPQSDARNEFDGNVDSQMALSAVEGESDEGDENAIARTESASNENNTILGGVVQASATHAAATLADGSAEVEVGRVGEDDVMFFRACDTMDEDDEQSKEEASLMEFVLQRKQQQQPDSDKEDEDSPPDTFKNKERSNGDAQCQKQNLPTDDVKESDDVKEPEDSIVVKHDDSLLGMTLYDKGIGAASGVSTFEVKQDMEESANEDVTSYMLTSEGGNEMESRDQELNLALEGSYLAFARDEAVTSTQAAVQQDAVANAMDQLRRVASRESTHSANVKNLLSRVASMESARTTPKVNAMQEERIAALGESTHAAMQHAEDLLRRVASMESARTAPKNKATQDQENVAASAENQAGKVFPTESTQAARRNRDKESATECEHTQVVAPSLSQIELRDQLVREIVKLRMQTCLEELTQTVIWKGATKGRLAASGKKRGGKKTKKVKKAFVDKVPKDRNESDKLEQLEDIFNLYNVITEVFIHIGCVPIPVDDYFGTGGDEDESIISTHSETTCSTSSDEENDEDDKGLLRKTHSVIDPSLLASFSTNMTGMDEDVLLSMKETLSTS